METVVKQDESITNMKEEETIIKESFPSSPPNDIVKHRHLKLLNFMKPSLSLTSLPPPQSPSEKSNDVSSAVAFERPYNSLKKKRDIEQQKELWRRSWESQNSVSTTTSHTGTSTGKNDFWTAYNYIMDNSIIDQCKETNREAKLMTCLEGENLKPIHDTNFSFNSTFAGSQGSQCSDPKRLRRWLREMENRTSKLPSLKEAMKLNANELQKFSVESTDLYREITSNGRFVKESINAIELENTTKTVECSEFDSLDTNATSTTTTSNESSKRGENVRKALERRYHLLYLTLLEKQCLFESLIGKRNLSSPIHNTKQIDTSDDEPIVKIPKFDENTNFTSQKSYNKRNESQIESDIEADSEHSEEEMECVALKSSDCVDSVIVPLKTSSPKIPPTKENNTSPKITTVVKKYKDFSKFNRSNRKSKNCAIFYYKHIDTDNDQKTDNELPIVSSEASEEELWEYANNFNDSNAESMHIINNDKAIDEQVSNENRDFDIAIDINLAQQQHSNNASNTTQLITKEALREYVLEAETLVRQNISTQTSKSEYFLKEILSTKSNQKQQQLQKKLMEKSQKDSVKINRVQEWLKKHQNSNDKDGMTFITTIQTTDCEASGEYTSGSEHSVSSEEITDSVATCLQGIDPLQTSIECLENVSPVHKVTMRSKAPNRRHSDRPWSVSCLSQLTRNSRQSLSDVKMNTETTQSLANFSISESALNKLQKYKTTSESDSRNCNKNTNNSVGSKNSLKKRKKLRKKSLSSMKKSESGSDIQIAVQNQQTQHTPKNVLKSMSKSENFNVTLMEDLSTAISLMSIMKNKQDTNLPQAQKPESEDEQEMKAPDFKIGSITNVYGNPHSLNLGSLAALSNYNNEDCCETNEAVTENLSSFSEHNMWDNYMEKYNSEAYSEDRDIDGARKLLDFGDDYRNFIDSQSDCCSSLSAANQLDSLSPPRHRRNISNNKNISLPSSNDNSMKLLLQQRIQEIPEMERQRDRKLNIALEKLRVKSNDHEHISNQNLSSSDEDDNNGGKKILAESLKNLEQTQYLRMANSQLLLAEDYDEIIRTCLSNIEQLECLKQHGIVNQKNVNDLIASWNNLLSWSENAGIARRLQEEIIVQRQLLDSFDINSAWVLNTEEAIREKIYELNNSREELYKHRPNMLKLNASVHSWLSRQEMHRNRNQKNDLESINNEQTTQSDLSTFADDELYRFLKDEIVSLYAKWDFINCNITTRLESLKQSLVCWKQFENGFEEFQENLSKDLGALNNLKGAIEEGATSPEELVDNVQQVSKLLSEKIENRIQTISTNEDFMLHPEAALKFITNQSSNGGSYQSDSGISDEGFSELSERERRLIALKKIAKQLETALSPSSEVLKTITQRMEAAENELKVLQNTCRELIVRTSSQLLKQQGIELPQHAQSQINVQIPIITIKNNKLKRSLPRRNKRKSPSTVKKINEIDQVSSNEETDTSDMDESKNSKWWFMRRVAKLAIPFQLTILTLFCVACLLEPRCCDTLNNLTSSLTPQLRYINGKPPT
ncbi:hypothetical protein PVAND_011538 [Polypedilum vanderplanki]|uniref:KASH domain-containing protein n=1 Tax=Polypedilum vanderplanki TaxID=319348 RepID=A0A9J6CJS3_POLVA|nr:hypothetical protein PVAND_011538 [Polypedilum vanderplanki]